MPPAGAFYTVELTRERVVTERRTARIHAVSDGDANKQAKVLARIDTADPEGAIWRESELGQPSTARVLSVSLEDQS